MCKTVLKENSFIDLRKLLCCVKRKDMFRQCTYLSGFKSLCTIPQLCRYSKARTVSAKYILAISTGRGPMFFIKVAQSPPVKHTKKMEQVWHQLGLKTTISFDCRISKQNGLYPQTQHIKFISGDCVLSNHASN